MKHVLNCLSRFLAGEPVTGRNYGILVKLAEEYLEDLVTSFFWDKIKMNFACFSSLEAKSYISRKINLHRNLVFGYRQDTKQADHAGQKPLFGVNSFFWDKDILVKKAFSILRELKRSLR